MYCNELVKKAAEYVKIKTMGELTGHDWYHIERVLKTAHHLHKNEGGNLELVEMAVLLHDLGDMANFEFEFKRGSLIVDGIMDVLDIPEEMQKNIIKVVSEARYAANETKRPSSIEGKIVQDADWLDSVGILGVARTFATGGFIKRMLHDPRRKPRRKLFVEDYLYRKQAGTSYNYFFEKILRLPAMMNTAEGKKIASRRIKHVEKYLEEFEKEWEGKDIS